MMKEGIISMNELKSYAASINLVKMRMDLENFKQKADIFKEHQKVQAGITKAKYDALVNEGFDPKQALELCKGILP